MFKKSIIFILITILMVTGCTNKPIIDNKNSNNVTVTNAQVNTSESQPIPYNYAFTGFVSVNDLNDLPIGTKVFNTSEKWVDFVNKSFPYEDIPLPVYSGGIDFAKDSLIYGLWM